MSNTGVISTTNQPPNIHTVSLEGQVPGGAGIEILRAEMRLDIGSPLAVVRYAEWGRETRYGLRLDIDKKVFIDHLANEAQEHVLQLAALNISVMLGVELRTMRYTNSPEARMLRSAAMGVSDTTINRNIYAQGEAVLPAVAKEARVVEEVVVGEQATQRTETVHDTVRRTDNEVEQIAGQTTTTGTTFIGTTGTVSHTVRDLTVSAFGTEGSIPGMQTGGHAVDGSGAADTRGIVEKIADTVTGSRVDNRTDRPV